MSVTTTADTLREEAGKKLKAAAELVADAQRNINQAIAPDTWGSRDYAESSMTKLRDIELRTLLMTRELYEMFDSL